MNKQPHIPGVSPTNETVRREPFSAACALDAQGHCITCSDEAVTARVLHVDTQMEMALVSMEESEEEIDIMLVDDVVPGDLLLVHGGVAIAKTAPTASSEVSNE